MWMSPSHCCHLVLTSFPPAPACLQVFAHAVPDPVNNPPVANINMDPGGRFAFVEFQKEELASKALEMDRVVRARLAAGGWQPCLR